MSKKGFTVTVEINIKSISCPGVWLCSNGKISLQLHMLGTTVQTNSLKPHFPIKFDEKYIFSKIFDKESRLNELQRSLNREWLYIEFIQWQSCEEGCVLSTFQTTLDDFLYPSSLRGCITGTSLELLMEPTKLFPGTLAPKIHVTTKTTISQTICDVNSEESPLLMNPKVLLSTDVPTKRKQIRNCKKVCHSVGYSRAKKSQHIKAKQPPFICSKATDLDTSQNSLDDLIRKSQRSPTALLLSKPCYCCRTKSLENLKQHCVQKRTCPCMRQPNQTLLSHEGSLCPTCSKYNICFSPRKNKSQISDCCEYCRQNAKRHGSRHIRTRDNSPCLSDVGDRRSCFCLPEPDPKLSLAQQLHKRFSETISYNSRMLRNNNCINCDE